MGQCFDTFISADTQVEPDETFMITINDLFSQLNISPTSSQATITILNDDGKHECNE